MIYEYACAAGHVTEVFGVKINGEGAPTECREKHRKCRQCGVAWPAEESGDLREHFGNCTSCGTYKCDLHTEVVQCGLPVKKIMSVPSGVFPGAGSWAGR